MQGLIRQNKGLSCVENYVLHIFYENALCPDILYYQSGISFADIVSCFENGETYAVFSGIDRLQHIAYELGIIDYQYLASSSLPDDLALTDKSYVMVCVTPSYISEKYQEKLWRDDHYILLTEKVSDNTYSYVNDRPFDQGEMSYEELKQIYHGSVIHVQVNKDLDTDFKGCCLLF